jgi:hypothetical protein
MAEEKEANGRVFVYCALGAAIVTLSEVRGA